MEPVVIRSRRRTLSMEIKQGRLIIRAPYLATDREIARFIQSHQSWIDSHLSTAQRREQELKSVRRLTEQELHDLSARALKVIPERVAHYAPLIGVTYGRITIRNQRTRWGSCSAKGNLNFNCLLMLAPPGVLDSVVVHELCHRKHMNHSAAFYAEVLRVFPDYWAQHGWLKAHGDQLLAMQES